MSTATGYIRLDDPIPGEQIDRIQGMDNNALIIRLMFTVNHISRWLTPIHDDDRLDRALYRGEPTAKDLVIRLREYDEWIYPRMFLAAHQPGANYDSLDDPRLTPVRPAFDKRETTTVVLISGFRRSRQSITTLTTSRAVRTSSTASAHRRAGITAVTSRASGTAPPTASRTASSHAPALAFDPANVSSLCSTVFQSTKSCRLP